MVTSRVEPFFIVNKIIGDSKMNYYKEKIGENYKDEIQVEVNYSFDKSNFEDLVGLGKLTDEEWKTLVENWDDECVVEKMKQVFQGGVREVRYQLRENKEEV